jgi:hypothetical protein
MILGSRQISGGKESLQIHCVDFKLLARSMRGLVGVASGLKMKLVIKGLLLTTTMRRGVLRTISNLYRPWSANYIHCQCLLRLDSTDYLVIIYSRDRESSVGIYHEPLESTELGTRR